MKRAVEAHPIEHEEVLVPSPSANIESAVHIARRDDPREGQQGAHEVLLNRDRGRTQLALFEPPQSGNGKRDVGLSLAGHKHFPELDRSRHKPHIQPDRCSGRTCHLLFGRDISHSRDNNLMGAGGNFGEGKETSRVCRHSDRSSGDPNIGKGNRFERYAVNDRAVYFEMLREDEIGSDDGENKRKKPKISTRIQHRFVFSYSKRRPAHDSNRAIYHTLKERIK